MDAADSDLCGAVPTAVVSGRWGCRLLGWASHGRADQASRRLRTCLEAHLPPALSSHLPPAVSQFRAACMDRGHTPRETQVSALAAAVVSTATVRCRTDAGAGRGLVSSTPHAVRRR